MRYEITTAPTATPISLAEVKTHLRIDHTADDTYLGNAIEAAVDVVEAYLKRSLIDQTITLYLDKWPSDNKGDWWDGVQQGSINELHSVSGYLSLPMGSVGAITSVKTYDDADAVTLWASDNYYLQGGTESRLYKRNAVSWPIPDRVADGIEIIYVAGYGAAGANVPFAIRQAILNMVAFVYTNRGECNEQSLEQSDAVKLLSKFKVLRI